MSLISIFSGMNRIITVKLGIGVIILLLQLLLYMRAEEIYGGYAQQAKELWLAYTLLTVGILAIFATPLPVIQINRNSLLNFFIAFVGTSLVMLLLTAIIPKAILTGIEPFAGQVVFWGYGIIHTFIKAFNEEIVFRGVIPSVIRIKPIGDIISSILFGIFHLAVSKTGIIVMIFLMFLGFAWSMLRDFKFMGQKMGLLACISSHAVYNMYALETLQLIFPF